MLILGYILLGVLTGVLSGFLGIGGGVFLVPALALIFGFTQTQAQGTSLSLFVLPVAIAGALTYYKSGNVNLPVVGLLAVGFIVGGILGSKYAITLPAETLRKFFGGAMLLIAIYMIVKK